MRRASFRDDRGQTIVMVALMVTAILGFVGIAADVAWLELNIIRMQRAADAAALAGVVYLPGQVPQAKAAARAEAGKNGYTDGVGGVTVTPAQDPINTRIISVDVAAPVGTFFARLLGVNSISSSRHARAEFVLPLPMGSPQDYYGIYQLCSGNGSSCTAVNRPPGFSGTYASQGFWGGVLTRGGQHSNGDAYSPQYDGGTNPNAQYDANGYSYSVDLPAGTTNGAVWIFDAPFCAVGHGASGSYLGTGDHWIGNGGQPVSTVYRLWDTNSTPYTTTDDTLIADSGSLFMSQVRVDQSGQYSGDGKFSDGGYTGSSNPSVTASDCQSDPYHNAFWKLADNLTGGSYRVQATTSDVGNVGTSAENMFGIAVTSSGTGNRVYGASRMAAYANVNGGYSTFYLAQVDAVHAGKTLEIRLFDPGDVGGNAYLRIKKPTSTGYVDASFSFTAVGGSGPSSGSGTVLQTASSGTSLYNNAWVTIAIPLPSTYGAGGPGSITPPGETQPGWWKIEYQITSAGNDTTTWEVNIRGNPVHLITP